MSENVRVLTPKQRRGVSAILESSTIGEAAELSKVNYRTVTRWLSLPAFTQELRAQQAAIIDRAAGRFVQGLDLALDTLEELMRSATSEGVRRMAASEWINQCMNIREATDIEKRLSILEKRLLL